MHRRPQLVGARAPCYLQHPRRHATRERPRPARPYLRTVVSDDGPEPTRAPRPRHLLGRRRRSRPRSPTTAAGSVPRPSCRTLHDRRHEGRVGPVRVRREAAAAARFGHPARRRTTSRDRAQDAPRQRHHRRRARSQQPAGRQHRRHRHAIRDAERRAPPGSRWHGRRHRRSRRLSHLRPRSRRLRRRRRRAGRRAATPRRASFA